MATRRVDFTVTSKGGVQGSWIAVGGDDVPLVNDEGSITLQSPKTHFLVWWFVGNPGAKLTIEGKVGQQTVVEVKESTIPPGQTEGAGSKRFDV